MLGHSHIPNTNFVYYRMFINYPLYVTSNKLYFRSLIGGPYCGNPGQRIRLHTGSNSVLVVMKSDFSVNEGGFKATYQAIPQVIVEPPNPSE